MIFKMGKGHKRDIIFLNDKRSYNIRYRSDLMQKLTEAGFSIRSHGFFDSFSEAITCLNFLVFNKRSFIVSSNLKANLICSVLRKSNCVVILNGLGRMRKIKLFRKFLILLFSNQKKSNLIVQNYADYRYLKLHSNMQNIFWIPGSGGTSRKRGVNREALIVQRDSKIRLVANSVKNIAKLLGSETRINIIGCNDFNLVNELFNSQQYKNIGYVDQESIFETGSIFIQPSGYGEGFPHTLSDAILSNLQIIITKKDYVRFGMYRLGSRRREISKEWLELENIKSVRNKVNKSKISSQIINIILEYTDSKWANKTCN